MGMKKFGVAEWVFGLPQIQSIYSIIFWDAPSPVQVTTRKLTFLFIGHHWPPESWVGEHPKSYQYHVFGQELYQYTKSYQNIIANSIISIYVYIIHILFRWTILGK